MIIRQSNTGNLLFLVTFFLLLSFFESVTGQNASAADKALNEAETAETIVQKVIDAYGGKDNIENITSVYARGRIRAIAFNDEGSYVLYLQRARKLRVDIEYSRSSERRILDGQKSFESIDMVPFSKTAGGRHLSMVYQYKQLDLPYELLKNVFRIDYEGKSDVKGVETAVLNLSDSEGPPMKVYVDTRNFHIVKVSGSFSTGGSAIVLSSELSDFRKVDGTILPFEISNYAGGQLVAETSIREYKINPKLSESLFSPVLGQGETGGP